MPRKQRFKPSRKPKQVEPATTQPTTTDTAAQQDASRPITMPIQVTPSTSDVSGET